MLEGEAVLVSQVGDPREDQVHVAALAVHPPSPPSPFSPSEGEGREGGHVLVAGGVGEAGEVVGTSGRVACLEAIWKEGSGLTKHDNSAVNLC